MGNALVEVDFDLAVRVKTDTERPPACVLSRLRSRWATRKAGEKAFRARDAKSNRRRARMNARQSAIEFRRGFFR